MTTLQAIRTELVRRRAFPKTDWLKIKANSPANRDQRRRVMEALGMNHAITWRMDDCGEVDHHGNEFRCNVPLCPTCLTLRKRQEIAEAAKRTFLGAANEQLHFVTVILPVTTRLCEVDEIVKKAKAALGSLVATQAKKDGAWDRVRYTAWRELARSTDTDTLTPRLRATLTQLGWPLLGYGRAVWRPHLHMIVDIGTVDRVKFRQALVARFDELFQVEVKAFDPVRSVFRNIVRLVDYSMKYRIEGAPVEAADGGNQRTWWPDEDIKAYAEWLMSKNGAFRSGRFSSSKRKASGSFAPLVTSPSRNSGGFQESKNEEPLQYTDWLKLIETICDPSAGPTSVEEEVIHFSNHNGSNFDRRGLRNRDRRSRYDVRTAHIQTHRASLHQVDGGYSVDAHYPPHKHPP